MPPPDSAVALLRSLDLLPDGPVLWGGSVRSRSPGVFIVEIASREDAAPIDIVAVRSWLERVPNLRLDGERPTPTELAARLAAFWLPGQTVLYVGRTSKALGPRVAALLQTPLGDRRPHGGGHWLRTLRNFGGLRIWWAETDAPEEYEDALATAVAASVEAPARAALPDTATLLPWANLESVTGERKATGITGAFLPEADGQAAGALGTAGSRSFGSGPAGTNRATASRSTRAPASTRRPASPRAAITRRPSAAAAAGAAKPLPPPTHVTASGLLALQAELEELRTVRRPEVILRVKHARELGDLRENADYEAARNEQSFLEGRIAAIEQLVKTAVVIEADHTGEVMLGSTVVTEIEGEKVTFHIVGSTEADPAAGRISNASPVGKALIGRRAGEEVTIRTPGHELHYRIIEVRGHKPT